MKELIRHVTVSPAKGLRIRRPVIARPFVVFATQGDVQIEACTG
jgi:hypothetical protein